MRFINLEHHPNDSRLKIADDDVCQTLNSRMGTGGGNVPLVLVFEPGVMSRCGGHIYEDVAGTVRANAGDNQQAVAIIDDEDDNS